MLAPRVPKYKPPPINLECSPIQDDEQLCPFLLAEQRPLRHLSHILFASRLWCGAVFEVDLIRNGLQAFCRSAALLLGGSFGGKGEGCGGGRRGWGARVATGESCEAR
jgi:hypothetical protein